MLFRSLPRKQYAAIISGRTKTIVAVKKTKFIPVSPATIQRMSSGKKGRICINTKIVLPFLPKYAEYFSVVYLPAIHITAFLPQILPMKYAVNDPTSTPREASRVAVSGPHTNAPGT